MHPNPILDTGRPPLPKGLCIIVGSPFPRHRLIVPTFFFIIDDGYPLLASYFIQVKFPLSGWSKIGVQVCDPGG